MASSPDKIRAENPAVDANGAGFRCLITADNIGFAVFIRTLGMPRLIAL
jgi:hypothetical protein